MAESVSDAAGGDARAEENPHPSGDAADHDDELEQFRARWKTELRERHVAVMGGQAETEQDSATAAVVRDTLRESQSKRLFLQGVRAEQRGLFYEATSFYRQAIKLVPDIEERLENVRSSRPDHSQVPDISASSSVDPPSGRPSADETVADLTQHFNNLRVQEQRLCICEPNTPQNAVRHISSLPAEVLLYILKWVVSADLDLVSLEQFSQVCSGFYLLARDAEVWKAACCRVWGKQCRLQSAYRSWRDMYINEPHLLFNGCYISKTSYARQGERGLDGFYRPFHVVDYYRYCRFFPDGAVLLYTSADDVGSTVSKLRVRQPRLQGLLTGIFRVTSGHRVQCILKRYKWQENNRARRRGNSNYGAADDEETFHVELTVKDRLGKKNRVLSWESYAVKARKHGTDVSSSFNLNPKDYPPFYFARVKSFTAEAWEPLS